jgi:hypothetical protein
VEDWQAKALEYFPELEYEINRNQGGATGLWGDSTMLSRVPIGNIRPEGLIRRIYDYAAWCFQQPTTGNAETDLSSATAVGLIESPPLDQQVSEDLYRWLSVETFDGCESLFRHHLSGKEYENFRSEFIRKKKEYLGPSRL